MSAKNEGRISYVKAFLKDRVVIQNGRARKLLGIILPTTAQEKLQFAKVTQQANYLLQKTSRSVDGWRDKVVFEKYSGTEVKLDGQEYIIVKEKTLSQLLNKGGYWQLW